MKNFFGWVVAFALVSGCSRDLTVPEPAPFGGLIGLVDTNKHISPAKIPVALVDSSGYRQVVLTEGDGAFRVENLRPGTFALDVEAPGFAPLVVPFIRVTPGADTDAGVLSPGWLAGTPQASSIKGRISAKETADISGATAAFHLMPSGDVVATATVGHDGLFIVSVPPGRYQLIATHPEFSDSVATEVTLAEGETKDLTSTPLLLDINKGHVAGTVKQEIDGNSPVVAVGVDVHFEGGPANATTDGQGHYTADVNPGTYRVQYLQNTGTPGAYLDPEPSRTVTVHGGQTIVLPEATLALARGVITGSVELSDRAPIDQLAVGVSGTGYNAQVTPDTANPWQGTFKITGVPYGGPYEVVAAKQRYSRASANVTVGATPVSTGTLKLALQQGDFVIDDGDPTSEPGYTRTLPVTLNFTGFPKTGVTGYRASETSDFGDAGFLSYSGPTQPFVLSDADGRRTVYAQYQEANSSISPTFEQTITVDRVPPGAPTVRFLDTGEVGQGATLVKFTSQLQDLPLIVTGSDTGAGLSKMRLAESLLADGGIDNATPRDAFLTSTAFKRKATTQGAQFAYVQLIDLAGNVSGVGADSIVVDSVAPVGTIAIADGPKATATGVTNLSEVEITPTVISAEPDGGFVQVKYANASGPELDGAPYVALRARTKWSLAFGPDSSRTVFAVFRDAAGNAQGFASKDIRLDTTPLAPSAVSASLASPSPTNLSTVKVAVSVAAGADLSTTAGLTVSEDYGFSGPGTVGPIGVPVSGQLNFAVSPGEGARPFFVRFRDSAGNDTVVPLSVMIDTTAPTGTIALLGSLADGTLSTSISSTATVNVQANVTGATGFFAGDGTLSACPTAAAAYATIPASGLFPSTPAPAGGTLVVRACFRDDAGNLFGGPVAASVSPLLWAPAATIGFRATPPTGCSLSLDGLMADGIASAPPGLTAKPTVSYSVATCVGATEMVLANGPLNCNSLPASTSWQPFLSTGTFNVPAGDGPKTVSVCVRDVARNPATVPPASITLDTTPPAPATVSATVTSPSPSSSLAVQLAISATATDLSGSAALTVSEDYGFKAGGTVGPGAMPVTGTLPFTLSAGDGSRTFYARFRDRVGNDTIVPLSVTIDTAPPSGSIALLGALADGSPSSALSATTSVTVQASVTGAVGYYLGDGALAACPATPGSYTALPSSGLFPATLVPASGALTVRACFRDAAGNVLGGPVTAGVSPLAWVPAATIAYDAAPPSGCALSVVGTNVDGSAAPAGKTAKAAVSFAVTGCVGASELAIANGPLTCASLPASASWQPFVNAGSITLPPGDALKTVSACVRDAARNLASPAPATITLDTTPPTLGSVSAAVSSPSPTNTLTLTVAVSSTAPDLSPSAALTVSEDYAFLGAGTVGPMGMPGSGTVGFTLSAGDGVRTFYARFRDAVGNDTIVPVNVTIDSAPPAGTIGLQGVLADGSPSSTVSAATAVSVQSSITGAVSYYLGDQTLASCPTSAGSYTAMPASGVMPQTIAPAGGALTSHACFRDSAGNIFGGPVAASVSPLLWVPAATIPYDVTAPSGCVLSVAGKMADTGLAAPAGLTGRTDVTFSIASCSAGTTEMALAASALSCASLPASVTWQSFVSQGQLTLPLGDGAKTVSLCARDAARNIATLTPVSITLDTSAPTAGQVSASVSSPNPSNTQSLVVAVSSIAVDLSPTAALTVSEDYAFLSPGTVGPSALPGSGSVNFTISAGDGARTFYARFKDVVGNGIVVPVNVTLDTVAPSGSLWIEGVLGDGSSSTTWSHQSAVTVHAEGVTGSPTGYFLGANTLAACPATAGSYTPMPSNGQIAATLSAAVIGGNPALAVRGCFRDAAGNVYGGAVAATAPAIPWAPSASIQFNASAPALCSVVLTGRKVDGTAAPAGRTARQAVTYTLGGCVGATEMVVSPTAISCAAALPSDWVPFQPSGVVTLPVGDGNDTVQLCARNAALNVATLTPASITLDTTPPTNSWTLVENGDGWVNLADRTARGGLVTRIDATYSGAYALVVEYNPALGLSTQTFVLGSSPSTVYAPLSAGLNPGQQQFNTYFIDDVGNATPRVSNTIGLDTIAPVAPVLSTIAPGNRSATLFWLPVSGDATVAGYGLVTAAAGAPLPAPPSQVTVSGNVGQGEVPGLTNRQEYQFAVYTFDLAGNVSPLSNAVSAITGFVQKRVPIITTYSVQPLDLAMRGNELFLTYQELGVGSWGSSTGNVRVAHSVDLGDTWTFATIDPEFGFSRTVGRLTMDGPTTTVATVGTNLTVSDAGVFNPTIGAVKVYQSQDGTSWTSLYDNTTTPADFSDVTSVGYASVGLGARVYYPHLPGSANDLYSRSVPAGFYLCGGFFFPPCPSPSYYNFTDNVPMKDLKTCTGNEAMVHGWRTTANAFSLVWQRFVAMPTLTPGGDGDLYNFAPAGSAVGTLDLACAGLPGTTDAYVLWSQGATMGMRKRLGSGTAWTLVSSALLPTDVDPTSPPHLYASGTSVHFVYRTVAGEVKLYSSTDEATSFSITRLSADPVVGNFPVIAGDGHADLAIASVSGDLSTISLLVPAMRNVHAQASPGIGTASLDWDTVGASKFRVDRNDAGVDPWPDTLFMAQSHYTVPTTPGSALFHRLSAADGLDQGTDDGQIWQVAPFSKKALYTPSAGCGTQTPSFSVVAHDAKVVAMGPLGCKAVADYDMTMYRSTDNGATFAIGTPNTNTLTSRSLAGANGRAVLAYKYTGFAGLRARAFADLTGAFPVESFFEAAATAEYISVGADHSTTTARNHIIAAANVAADNISVVSCDPTLATPCTLLTHITVPATATLSGVSVWRVEGSRVAIAWRAYNSAGSSNGASYTEQIWYAESTNGGSIFAASVLLSDGSVGLPPSAQGSRLSGSGNGAYSVLAREGSAPGDSTGSLYLHVTGNDLPSSGYSVESFVVDSEAVQTDVMSAQSSPSGHYVLYETLNYASSKYHLKMVFCRTDCHKQGNWSRSTLATLPSGLIGSALGISTLTAPSTDERMYALYYDGTAVQFLYGGALRRTR